MGEKDDGLVLSLSLKCPENPPPHFPSNLPSMFQQKQKTSLDAFQPAAKTRSYLRGIDIDLRPPSTADCEEAGGSSPNSTISNMSGKRNERGEIEGAERRGWACIRGAGDEDEGRDTARKKLRLSKEQSAVLEETFKEHNTLNPKNKVALARQLSLQPRQVEVWFQNRRARTKLKQTEVDCDYLKRCCENLTDENRRLQKIVNDLRALKLSPRSYLNMNPPTTLTMCISCDCVAVQPTSSSSAAASTSPPSATTANGLLKPAPHPITEDLHPLNLGPTTALTNPQAT